MNTEIENIIRDSECRYLEEGEQKKILAFTASLPARFRAASAVEAREEVVVRGVVEQMRRLYPNFERYHAKGWEKAYRDIQISLRFTVQAMVWNNIEMQEDKLLTWLASILASFGFTPKFNRETYTLLRDGIKANVSQEVYAMLDPYLAKNIEILGSIPEPAMALV